MDPIYLYPHEAPGLLLVNERGPRGTVIALSEHVLYSCARFFREKTRGWWRANSTWGDEPGGVDRYNGGIGLNILYDKNRFPALVRRLGYFAPRSARLRVDFLEQDLAALATSELAGQCPVFCKPYLGGHGEGISLQPDIESAVQFVAQQNRDYVLQSHEPSQQDWRYILHRDVWELSNDQRGRMWRIAYKKLIPVLVGDGTSTVRRLLQQADEIPAYAAFTYRFLPFSTKRLGLVLDRHERFPLIDTANISKGAYAQLARADELQNMDRFMTRFHRDLEHALGSQIATSCLDVGVKEPAALQGDYDHQRIQRAVSFYEFQMPFACFGYLLSLGGPTQPRGFQRLLPRRIARWQHTVNTGLRFYLSVFQSGRELARRSVAEDG